MSNDGNTGRFGEQRQGGCCGKECDSSALPKQGATETHWTNGAHADAVDRRPAPCGCKRVGAGGGHGRCRRSRHDERVHPGGQSLSFPADKTALLPRRTVLELGQAALYVFHIANQLVDLHGEVAWFWWAHVRVARSAAHVRALPLSGHDQASRPKLSERTLGGLDSYAVLVGERPVGRQLLAGRQRSALDFGVQAIRQLTVRRPRVLGIKRVHGPQHTSPASRDSFGDSLALRELSKTSKLALCSILADIASLSARHRKTPTGAATPAGAHIETLGETMQIEDTRLYRVKAVAEALDVSAATIYRAVESGALRASRLGTGKGAVRISGDAIKEYMAACEQAAATSPQPVHAALRGQVCVICGTDLRTSDIGAYIVGQSNAGSDVYACVTHQVHSSSKPADGAA